MFLESSCILLWNFDDPLPFWSTFFFLIFVLTMRVWAVLIKSCVRVEIKGKWI